MSRMVWRSTGQILLCVLVGAALTAKEACASSPDPLVMAQVRAFLEGYTRAGLAQSPDFYDSYSDRAVIHIQIQGEVQDRTFQGRDFKAWSRQLLQDHRIAIEPSEFHHVSLRQQGARLVLRAERYSISRCFWDKDYEVALEPEQGPYRIVEERLTSDPHGACPAPAAGAVTAPEGEGSARDQIAGASATLSAWRPPSPAEISRAARKLAEEFAASQTGKTDGTSALPAPPKSEAKTPSADTEADALWVLPGERPSAESRSSLAGGIRNQPGV